MQNDIIWGDNKGFVPDQERDPYGGFFAPFKEVEDRSDENNKDDDNEEVKEREEDCNDDNGEYGVVDNIKLVLESFHSNISTT